MNDFFNYLRGLVVVAIGTGALALLGCFFEYLYNHKLKFVLFHLIGVLLLMLSFFAVIGFAVLCIPLLIAGFPLYYLFSSNNKDRGENKGYLDWLLFTFKDIQDKLGRWYEDNIK